MLIGAGNYIINHAYYETDSYQNFCRDIKDALNFDINKIKVRIMTGNSGIGKSSFWRNFHHIDFEGVLGKNVYSSTEKRKTSIKEQGIILRGYESELDNNCDWSPKYELERLQYGLYEKCDNHYNKFGHKLLYVEEYAKLLLNHSCEIDSAVVIIYDNLDLCADEFAKNILKFVHMVKNKISELLPQYTKSKGILLVVNVRPDTYKYYKNFVIDPQGFSDFHEIRMPLPDVYRIVRNNFFIAANIICLEWKQENKIPSIRIEITHKVYGDNEIIDEDVIITSMEDLTEFIIKEAFNQPRIQWKINDEYKKRNFLNMKFDKFISRFTDFDVRRFNRFITYCFMEGTYFPFKESTFNKSFAFKRYDFLRLLILGTKSPYKTEYDTDSPNKKRTAIQKPYIGYIDEAGYYEYNTNFDRNLRGPDNVIIFNIFETFNFSSSDMRHEPLLPEKFLSNGYENVFLLYIRILQRLWLLGHEGTTNINVQKIKLDLMPLFDDDEKIIEAALKRMIYNGFIFEKSIGSRNCFNVEEVILERENEKREIKYATFAKVMKDINTNPDELDFHCAAALYISELIMEYQYIYQMGAYYITEKFSAMRDPSKNMQRIDYRRKAKEILSQYISTSHDLDVFFTHQNEEYTVVLFLIAVSEIMKFNKLSYDDKKFDCYYKNILDGKNSIDERSGKLKSFILKEDKYMVIRPFSRMVEGVVKALEGKIDTAYSYKNEERSRKLILLKNALKDITTNFQNWLANFINERIKDKAKV